MNDEIMKKMAECEQKNVEIAFKTGKVLTGYVDVFESRYDNDGEASICFAGDGGEMIIIEESEIEEIKVAS